MKIPIALSIAGVDPDAGAGVYADLKTFQSLGVYGIAVITALTAQNTFSFSSLISPPKGFFIKQITTLLDDIKPCSTKIGMIPEEWMVDVISRAINEYKLKKIVVDPIYISKTNKVLTPLNVLKKMVDKIFPLSYIVTPNIYEAEVISGLKIKDEDDMLKVCEKIYYLSGVKNILLKGGHFNKNHRFVYDLFWYSKRYVFLKHLRFSKEVHGTGCNLSSSIACYLAFNYGIFESVKKSIEYICVLFTKRIKIGKGNSVFVHDL